MIQKIKLFLEKYPHGWALAYFPVYLLWFIYLERRTTPYHVIHFPLDDYIPFCELFIIPYLLWFAYVAVTYGWLFLKDRLNFRKFAVFLYTGMTIFLIVSTLYPNGHLLRPLEFERHNIFVRLVCFIYWADTSTNILPSIHVFNSIACHMAVLNTPELRQKKWIVRGSHILCVSIVLSTMFLKQHSCLDVLLGITLALIMDQLIYHSSLLVKSHHLVGELVGKNGNLPSTLSRNIHRTAKHSKI